MIWQFGELGYDYSINYPSGTSSSRLDPKPIRWDYFSQWGRKYLYNVYHSLIGLKQTLPAFRTSTFTMNAAAYTKRITLTDATMDAVILGNFNVISQNVVPNFTKTGTWYEFYSGDSLSVSDVAAPLAFTPGEYRLYTTVRLPKPVFTGIENPGRQAAQDLRMTVYPNPSAGPVNFELLLDRPTEVKLFVYDFSGRLAGTVIEGNLPQGVNTLKWNPEYTPAPGMYFYKLMTPAGLTGGKFIVQ